jgi:hypothetical protein
MSYNNIFDAFENKETNSKTLENFRKEKNGHQNFNDCNAGAANVQQNKKFNANQKRMTSFAKHDDTQQNLNFDHETSANSDHTSSDPKREPWFIQELNSSRSFYDSTNKSPLDGKKKFDFFLISSKFFFPKF